MRGAPLMWRRGLGLMAGGSRRIKAAEKKADSFPADSQSQLRLLRMLNESQQWKKVRSRVESGRFALDEAGRKEYVKAMAAMDRLDSVDPRILVPERAAARPSGEQEAPFEAGRPMRVKLDAEEPLRVQLHKDYNLLRTLMGALSTGLVFYLIYNMMSGRSGMLENLTAGTHKEAQETHVRLADVIGMDEIKDEVQTLVNYLRDPRQYHDFGVRMPKGILLYGPPGVGKTLLAKAIAGEAGVPFFFISAAGVDEMFVGLGARRIRKLFETAKANAPAIIFIDEIDAIGTKRAASFAKEYNQTQNQLLTLMDGFEENTGVVVVAATNVTPDDLDGALMRSGRFDKKIRVFLPQKAARKEMFRYYLSRTPVSEDVDLDNLARVSFQMSGADIANVVNVAGIAAVNEGKRQLEMHHLREAMEEVRVGPRSKSLKMTEEEKKQTAWHEAGHTVVALFAEGGPRPHQVTIISRGGALGYMTPDMEDSVSESMQLLNARLAALMGGRAAEDLIYGKERATTGCSSDYQTATRIAEAMVAMAGYDPSVGPVAHATRDQKHVSEQTKARIDEAVRKLLQERYDYAVAILKKHSREHRALYEALMEREILSGDEILEVTGLKQ